MPVTPGDPVAAAREEFAAGLGLRLETMRRGLAALEDEFRPDDAETLYRTAHNLRGTGASYGAAGVAGAAGELERLALGALRAGRLSAEQRGAAAATLTALEAAVRDYQAEIRVAVRDSGFDRLAVVGRLATLINTRFDLGEIFRTAILEVRRVLDFRRASVVLKHPGGTEYYLHTLFDSLQGGFVESRAVFPIDQGLTGEAMRLRHAIRADSLPGTEGILAQQGARVSAMIIPLQPGGDVIGTLNFGHAQEGHYTEDDLAWGRVIGRQVETALYYSKLFSTIDRQRNQLEALIDASDAAIMLVAPDGKVAHVNREMARLVGIPREAVLHADLAKIHGLVRASFADPAALADQERALGGEYVLSDQVELLFPTTAVFRRVVAPVREAKGEPVGHIVLYRDVTREVESDRLKSEFVSIVSHELRTPMTSVKASLSLLLGGAAGTLDPAAGKLLEIALRNSDRLIRLVDDLLDFSRIEAGRLALHPEPVSLDDVVRFSVETVAAVAGEQEVRLVAVPPPEPVIVLGVRDRLVQVVVNLLANAIKFSPPDGRVQVRWWYADEAAMLEVADEGPGIPRDKLQTVFEPFRQIDSSTTRARGGAGLGLPITRGIVEALGGSVWAESEEGHGARFLVRLRVGAGRPAGG